MKISVKQLPVDKALILEEEIDPKDLDLDIGVMHFSEPLSVRAEAWKDEGDLTLNVHLEGERKFTCSLCLEEFNNLFEKDFTLHYDIKGLEVLEVDQDIRDEIILEHPIRILCRADCKGLCPHCGANLNEKHCAHVKQ
jgi:uncharacterized protein